MNNRKKNNHGFTLLEIMIAMTVFSMFVTAFVVSQGNNLADSTNMRAEYELKNILEKEVNELIINPPEFAPGLLITTENNYKTIEDFENFEKKIEWFEFKLPDLSQLTNSSSSGVNSDSNSPGSVQSKVFENVSKNLKELLWQMKITVRHKETGRQMEATSWLMNTKAKVKFEGF